MTSKTWDLTLNNYTDADIELLESWADDCKRLVVSKEVGEGGTPHLQGRITFARSYRLSGLKKLIPRAHWEKTMCVQDSLYCKKEDSELILNVDNRKQGQRSDLDELRTLVDSGATKLDLFEAHFPSMVRYHKGIYEYRCLKNARRKRPAPEVIWFYGPSGSGKSTHAEELAPEAYWVCAEHGDKIWWDGYDGQDTIIFDDFRPTMMTYGDLLKLTNNCGRYRLAIKGGSDWLTSKRIIFTSDRHPRDMYAMYDEQLHRRISTFKSFDQEKLSLSK